ncbi:MAG TPA: hypothetical protein VMG08_10485 [Allosphingosinicella sp.]|nr:hypothetical protein [Allosphingosinicella sp.]
MKTARFLLAAAAFACCAGTAIAQNTSLRANYGELELEAGFANDPRVISLRAGGDRPASRVDSSCRGFITNAPDVRLHYDAGSLPLIISVDAGSDTTLVVNGPNGEFYCDDDSGEGTNPSIRLNNPDSGRYEIWVGTYSSGNSQPARLYISEVSSR